MEQYKHIFDDIIYIKSDKRVQINNLIKTSQTSVQYWKDD
jgi:hypothetical protein